MKTVTRTFDDRAAVREKTPLLVGLVGPSSTGKTFSALRLATGIQRVAGGEIFGIDTEANRMLHYADRFKFRHVEFGSPFSPLDYLACIEQQVKKGAKTIIIDSMSHEHEGQGGVLEEHEDELDRMAGKDAGYRERDKYNFPAWAKPKAKRRRLIASLLQMNCNFVFCFRAKEKLKKVGSDLVNMGWQPIAGEEFIFEMTVKCLLLPGADGIPSWQSDFVGEKAMMKLPEQFKQLFASKQQLSEDIGEQLARWAAGAPGTSSTATPSAAVGPSTVDDLIAAYGKCEDAAHLARLKVARTAIWKSLSDADADRVKAAAYAAQERVELAEKKAS